MLNAEIEASFGIAMDASQARLIRRAGVGHLTRVLLTSPVQCGHGREAAYQTALTGDTRNETVLLLGLQPPLVLLGAKRITHLMARRHPDGPSRFSANIQRGLRASPAGAQGLRI
jgi:hypothetical protein